MQESQPNSRETVRVLAALSDENRFRIVSHLASEGEELTCGAISKALDISPSLLSHHLAILAEAGIVGRRKNGLWTMNVLERPVIARQVEVLRELAGVVAANGANGSENGERANGGDPVATRDEVAAGGS
ncbi:MAG TPA: metalloregulator ArsR/SmtB family transcription factor [Longimicrobiales bacterium]|nr:metalloregulator ArsR/SmtB family transcription factor [Longimicrobiales bacterium]